MQFSLFEDHLPRDFLSQFEFSRSDPNMMEDKQIFIRYESVDFNEILIYLHSPHEIISTVFDFSY